MAYIDGLAYFFADDPGVQPCQIAELARKAYIQTRRPESPKELEDQADGRLFPVSSDLFSVSEF